MPVQLTSTLGLSDEEQAERLLGVGGSEVGAVHNAKPYHCGRQLGYLKLGTPRDFPPEKPALWDLGHHLEPLATHLYVLRTGRTVESNVPAVVHPQYPWRRASPDGIILASAKKPDPWKGRTTNGMYEIKSLDPWFFRKVQREGLKETHILQGHWTCGNASAAVKHKGFTWGAFNLIDRNSGEIIEFDYDLDTELYEKLGADVDAWWDMKERGKLTEPLDVIDDRCKKCEWRWTCRGHGLSEAIPSDHRDVPLEGFDSPELQEALSEYFITKAEAASAKKNYEAAQQLVIEAITERDAAGEVVRIREAVQCEGATIIHRFRSRSGMDTKGLMALPPLVKITPQEPHADMPHAVVLKKTVEALTKLGFEAEVVLVQKYKTTNPKGGGRPLLVYLQGDQ